MGGSGLYTDASEYGVGNASTFSSSGADSWSRPGGSSGGADVGAHSTGGGSFPSTNDSRLSTQVRFPDAI